MAEQKASAAFLFSSLTASRGRQQRSIEIERNTRELLLEEEEAYRKYLIKEVSKKLRPQHLPSYDAFNLCECAREKIESI